MPNGQEGLAAFFEALTPFAEQFAQPQIQAQQFQFGQQIAQQERQQEFQDFLRRLGIQEEKERRLIQERGRQQRKRLFLEPILGRVLGRPEEDIGGIKFDIAQKIRKGQELEPGEKTLARSFGLVEVPKEVTPAKLLAEERKSQDRITKLVPDPTIIEDEPLSDKTGRMERIATEFERSARAGIDVEIPDEVILDFERAIIDASGIGLFNLQEEREFERLKKIAQRLGPEFVNLLSNEARQALASR